MEDRIITYGGQALIEGVLMRGQKALAIALRAPSGQIVIHTEKLSELYQSQIAKIPFLRGVILLWDALGLGTKALTLSANTQSGEKEKLEGASLYATLGLSLVLGIGLFFLAPYGISKLTVWGLGLAGVNLSTWWAVALLEGLTRLALIVGYIWAIGQTPEIRRVFQYHGAEHKTINAFEAGAELTPESVAAFPLEHPRCGTSFLLTLVLFSIIAFSFLHGLPGWLQVLGRLALIPVLAGVSLEYIRWAANHLQWNWVRGLIAPNLALQRLTTREPDLEMLEVAIRAFESMREAEQA